MPARARSSLDPGCHYEKRQWPRSYGSDFLSRRPKTCEECEEGSCEMTPEELTRRRGLLGLTQGELSERLGAPLDTLSGWECGDGRPEAEGMLGLAMDQLELLGAMDPDPLIGQIELRMGALKAPRNELARMDRAARKK